MLKSLTIENYKTFMKRTTIDFKASHYKYLNDLNVHNGIVKGALFVGGNATGKTTIIKSIKLLFDLLFQDLNELPPFSKCLFSNKQNYELEYVFEISRKDITYSFEIEKDKIVSEKLFIEDNLYMSRINNGVELYEDGNKKKMEAKDGVLFIRELNFNTKFNNNKLLLKWFEFLTNSVYVNCYDAIVTANSKTTSLLGTKYVEKNGVDELNEIFEKLNLNQRLLYLNIGNKNDLSMDDKKYLFFLKNGTDMPIPGVLESTGNVTLTEILPSFLHAIKKDCILLVDEFSSGFHNNLEFALLKYFFTNSKKSQIFFVSHSTNLLDSKLLRPDQIYSVDFIAEEGSIVKRFSSETPRESQNFEKMYLSGVFNGIPNVNTRFENK